MEAYQEMIAATSTPRAPWYVIPADHKWFTRYAVGSIINETLARLKLAYPEATDEEKAALLVAKKEMEQEKS
jgi:hypothetical protein